MRRATCSCIVPPCGSVGVAGVIVEAGVCVLDPSAFLCEMGVEVRVSSLSGCLGAAEEEPNVSVEDMSKVRADKGGNGRSLKKKFKL